MRFRDLPQGRLVNWAVPDRDPAAMSRMARRYLLVTGVRNLLIALVVTFAPATFTSALYAPWRSTPMEAWAVALVLVGGACCLMAWLRRPDAGRVVLAVSIVLTLLVFVLVLLGAVDAWDDAARLARDNGWPWWWYFRHDSLPGNPSPLPPILLGALVAKDAVMIGQPMRDALRGMVARLEER